jgi:hypothetical protein
MPPDDGCMTKTCCGNNIRRGGELLHWWTINCLMNINKLQWLTYRRSTSIFNSYFSSKADDIIATNKNERNINSSSGDQVGNIFRSIRTHCPRIEFRYTSTQEVDKIIKIIKSKRFPWVWRISVKILKWNSPFIFSPLTYIYNESLEMGAFPSRLKCYRVKPIYKSGDKQNISNFRLISLLISFSKVFEKIIYSRIHNHMVQYSVLAKEEYSFRHDWSTDKASYILTHEI